MRITIQAPTIMGKDARVWIDGREFSDRIEAISVHVSADDLVRANVRFLVDDIQVDGELAEVVLDGVGGDAAEAIAALFRDEEDA